MFLLLLLAAMFQKITATKHEKDNKSVILIYSKTCLVAWSVGCVPASVH